MFNNRASVHGRLAAASLLLLALFLSACGGGGSGSALTSGGGTGSGAGSGGGGGGYGGTPAPTPAPTLAVTLTGSPIAMGQSATLTWSSSGASSCTASGAWSGAEPVSGSIKVAPTAAGSYTYTLSCTGSSGTTSKSTTLTVGAAASAGPYTLTELVANAAGTAAQKVDPNLVNPWGIVFAPGAPVWVANNATLTSTLYDGSGNLQPAGGPLVVKFAVGAAGPDGPTGIVANTSKEFVVSSGGKTAAANFIYVRLSGEIAGWSSGVDPIHTVRVYADAGAAAYTGAAIAALGGHNYLYAADFHNAKIDVFDATFQKQTPSSTTFSFKDPALPAGYAPFGLQAIANGSGGATRIYVTYAQQKAPDNQSSKEGAGLGLVNVFDANGQLQSHLIAAGGALNAPWGIALAPADFGALSKDLLIGNLGDGKINAFDAATGNLIGAVSGSGGAALAVPGLWGIAFGNDSANQPHNTLFYAAGTDGGTGGVYGRIDVGAAPPTLNPLPPAPPMPPAPPPAAPTLAQLQEQVFGPICSGCHNGVGTSLPGVQNLTTAAATYASLVGVTSIEQPNLMRVKPGDPTNSYVIHKLEGAAGITGARMPFGGPYLSQTTIDQIQSWISAGAQND